MNVLDLFSGIGGFSLGLERAGMKTVAFCENNTFCQRVLAKHWPEVPILDDVTAADFPAADIIVGGFPCQDISLAGKRAGVSGARSGLYRELVRAIRVVRPTHAILENVAALLGNGMGTVLGDLAESGCDAEWDCVPACALGAPHQRDRVFIVAHASSEGPLPAPYAGIHRGEEGTGAWDVEPQRHTASSADTPHADSIDDDGCRHGAEYDKPSFQTNICRSEGNGTQASDASPLGRGQGWPGGPPDSFARIRVEARRNAADPYGARLAFREGFGRDAWEELQAAQRGADQDVGQSIWPDEPPLSGMDDEIPDWMERVAATGNTLDALIPELIGRAIMEAAA